MRPILHHPTKAFYRLRSDTDVVVCLTKSVVLVLVLVLVLEFADLLA